MQNSTMIDVTALGADSSGSSVSTVALQKAIDAAAACGGTVLFPPGTYLTGTLHLRSRITVHLQPGARILGSPHLEDYPLLAAPDGDRTSRHLLYGCDLHDLRITGGGTIDGNGPAFWEPTIDPPGSNGAVIRRVAARETDPAKQPITWIQADNARRPSPMFVLENCRDVRIDDITITNSAGWNVHLHHCDFVWIRGVKLDANLVGPNNDGFDIMGCSDVFISDCYLSCCDDAICLKTEKNGRPCERITVTNCVIRSRCAAFKCGWSDSFADFRQITFSNSVVFESHRAVALYSMEGATIEDITISNIVCDTHLPIASPMPVHIDLRRRHPHSAMGKISNISISNVIARTDGRVMLTAEAGAKLENILLRDLQLIYPAVENAAVHSERKSSQHSNANPDAKAACAAIVAENVDGLAIEGLLVRWPVEQDPTWVPAYKAANGEPAFLTGASLYPQTVPSMAILWNRGVTNLGLQIRSGTQGHKQADVIS